MPKGCVQIHCETELNMFERKYSYEIDDMNPIEQECSCKYCPVHTRCICNVMFAGPRPVCKMPGHSSITWLSQAFHRGSKWSKKPVDQADGFSA